MAVVPQVELLDAEDLATPEFGAAWDRLRACTPTPTAFSLPAFATAVASCLGFNLVACGVRSRSGGLAGGALCFTQRVGPYTRAVVPPFVQYTPVLLERDASEHEVHSGNSVLQAILEDVSHRFGGVALHLLPETRDLRPAIWSGFRVRPLYTYRIALEDEESIQSSWSDNASRLFRRFTDTFQISVGVEHTRDVIDLCAGGYSRHGRRLPVGADRLGALVRQLDGQGMVRVFALRSGSDGTCEAGVVVLHDDAVAHYWIAGSRPGPAMTVLLGHMLQRLTADGLRLFDFVGANTPSIAEFKRRFGPQLVPYHRVELCGAIGLRVLDLVQGRGA